MRHAPALRRLAVVCATAFAVGGAGLAALSGESGPAAPDAAARGVLAAAKTHLGEPYSWGGSGPSTWDCSGFTSTLWREVGGVDDIPRTSQAQAAWAIPIDADDALPGDLVFFDEPVSHVSIYLGRGRIIDASSARGGVVIRNVWTSGVVRYGRVPRPGAPHVRTIRGSRGGVQPLPAARPVVVKEDGRLNAVPRVGYISRRAPRPVAARLAAQARGAVGARYARRGSGPAYDAAGLVATSWQRAGGGRLPTSAAVLERRTTRVRVRDIAPGDLVFYGSPAVHVGIYVGGGMMVDSSRVLAKVVLRPVFRSDTVRFGRIVAAKPAPVAKPRPSKAPGAKPARKQPARSPAKKPARRPRGR